MNSIYENRPIAAPDADKYGHVRRITPGQRIAYSKLSEPASDEQRVVGLDAGQGMRVKRILAPTDLSDDSRKAVNYAVRLARLVDAQLTLLHFYDESWRRMALTDTHRDESMLKEERTARSDL